MPNVAYRLKCRVWIHPGPGGWHFATLPKRQGREIRALFGSAARGWGSLPVQATVGRTAWRTSIFPDAKSGSYLLPLKASVRKAEGIEAGKVVAIQVEVMA